MATAGLFTRSELKTQEAKASRQMTVDVASLRKMGAKAVRNMNPHAAHPEMEPEGPRRADVYLLGEAPDEDDDRAGRPFAGRAHRMALAAFGRELGVRVNYAVRTLPPYRTISGKRTRAPVPMEVECFRPDVEADVARSRPKAIVGLGQVPLAWALGELGTSVAVCRGRRFPVRVGGHACWFYPVYHPAYVLRVQGERQVNERGKMIPGEEVRRMFDADLQRVAADVEAGLPDPPIEDATEENLFRGVELIEGGDLRQLGRALDSLRDERCTANDVETNRLRPYERGAKVLSLSIGTYKRSYGIAIDHPQAKWTRAQRPDVLRLLLQFFRNTKQDKVCHNLIYDLEWYAFLFGVDFLRETGLWHCTMQQAYSLDERKGGFSLNFVCAQNFGLLLKNVQSAQTLDDTGLFSQAGKVDRSKLERTRLDHVLRYNALDSKYTYKNHRVQVRRLKAEGLYDFYLRHQNARIPTLVEAQWDGIPVHQPTVKKFEADLTAEVQKYTRLIAETAEARRFVKRFGAFDPENNHHVTKMFKELLQRPEGVQGKKYSTEADVLKAMDLPLADLILSFRDVTKSLSTYVLPLDVTSKDTVVFPDGHIHTAFKPSEAESGRTASEDPNVQNFPKRKNKYIRRAIAPVSDAMRFVAIDYGALEYRGIGMYSLDPVIVDSLWNDYDVHMVWTKKIVKVLGDRWFQRRFKGDWKDARGAVKNEFVFPLFYGSSWSSAARNLEVEGDRRIEKLVAEFKQHFKGVFDWQRRMVRQYEKHLYVECLTGRRRRGPLSYNMIINSPIQGTCSDLVVDAMTRIALHAHRHDKPEARPSRRARLNIHDDLTFVCPAKKVDALLDTVVPLMCDAPFAWTKCVPLVVEVSVGPNWCDLEEIGKFSSRDYGHTRDN